MPVPFGDRLRRERIVQGLTLAELGHKIGVTGPRISQWESGFAISDERIIALEQVLGFLVTGENENEGADETILSTSAFSVWLTKAGAESQMSVPELARASGLSAAAIYNLESGRSQNPQIETKVALERALKKAIPEDVKSEIVKEQKIEGLGVLRTLILTIRIRFRMFPVFTCSTISANVQFISGRQETFLAGLEVIPTSLVSSADCFQRFVYRSIRRTASTSD